MSTQEFETKLKQIDEQDDELKLQVAESKVGDLVLEYFPYEEKDNEEKKQTVIANMPVILKNAYQYDILKLFNTVQTIKNPNILKSILNNIEQLTKKEYNPNIFKYLFNNSNEEILNQLDFDKVLSGPFIKSYFQFFNSLFMTNPTLDSQKFFDIVFTRKLDSISLIDIFQYNKNPEYYIHRYSTNIINYISNNTKDIIELRDFFDYIYIDNPNKLSIIRKVINDIIDTKPLECFKNYLLSLPFKRIDKKHTRKFDLNNPDFDAFCEIAAKVVLENAHNENIAPKDIQIDYDTLCDKRVLFIIGSKVIKITNIYQTFNTIKIPELLTSLMRRKFIIDGQTLYIEVVPLVDTKSITEEDVYTLFKKVRSYGLIWTDTEKENIGHLLEDNKINVDRLNPSYKSLGYIDELNNNVLQKGDLVILDNDFIFREDDPSIISGSPKWHELEERYQEELSSVKKM